MNNKVNICLFLTYILIICLIGYNAVVTVPEEKNIQKGNSIIYGATLPKYFRISFDLWLEEQKVIRTWRKILQISGEQSSSCSWPELYIHEHTQTKLNHAFKCIRDDAEKPYIFQNENNISNKNWHQIEYTQLPIPNSPFAELTISINGKALHRIVSQEAQEQKNIEVYFGYKQDETSNESTIPEGKIRNFVIEEYESG